MKIKQKNYLILLTPLIFQSVGSSDTLAEGQGKMMDNVWQPLFTLSEGGLVGERVNLWRNKRLWNIAESGYLLGGFESRPGIHPWQGEHVGKWLHSATLAYNTNIDEKLKKLVDETVQRLIATQLPDGYLGTYGKSYTFMATPENGVNTQLADDIQPTKKGKQKGDVQGSDEAAGGWWDSKWIAFTYGPFVLAQKISKMPNVEPFMNLSADKPSEILKKLSKSPASETEFSIEGTDITLVPYYQTGSDTSGSRTFFKL